MNRTKDEDAKRGRPKFTIRTLLLIATLFAVCLGGWIGYKNQRIWSIEQLRNQGAIVILRDRPPGWLSSVGVKTLRPFTTVPTVELYVTPAGDNARVGSNESSTTNALAQDAILKQANVARSNGTEDIQLIIVGEPEMEWFSFAKDNSMAAIVDTAERYAARLKANVKTGANINPQ